MATYTKIIRDIYTAPLKAVSKVNFKQYMTNQSEPAESIADILPGRGAENSQVIDNAYPRKRIFRRIALNLRLGNKK